MDEQKKASDSNQQPNIDSSQTPSPSKLNKDMSDFMLMEYEQIAKAHFELGSRRTSLFRYYLALIAIPITLIAAVIGLRQGAVQPISLDNMPDFVAYVLGIVAIAGFLLSILVMEARFEGLMYARVVNLVRRWFAKRDPASVNFLFLPITDDKPSFSELKGGTGTEIILIAVLDGLLMILATYVFVVQTLKITQNVWYIAGIVGVGFLALHIGIYRIRAWRREKNTPRHFTTNL